MAAMSIGFKKDPPRRRRQARLVLRLLLEALGLVGDAVLGRAQVGDRLRDGGEPLVHVHAVDRGQLKLVSVGIADAGRVAHVAKEETCRPSRPQEDANGSFHGLLPSSMSIR